MLTFVRYFWVYFTFGLLDCVLYKRITLHRGSVLYILLYLWSGQRVSLAIPRTWLYRGSLHRSSTVPEAAERECLTKVLVIGMSK